MTESPIDFSQLKQHILKRIEITDEEFAQFISMIKVIHLNKKEFFSQSGEICDAQAYVNKGCLATYYTDDKAHNHVIQIGVEDWWIGDVASFLNGTPTRYNVEALEECELFTIDAISMEMIFEKIPRFERFFRLLVQKAYAGFQQRVMEGMSKSAEERYLDFMKKYPGLKRRVAQHYIASYLGISPEALSRIKKSMIVRERSSK